MMDFAALPPEVNSGLMYVGPGAGPMLAAAGAWSTLAGELTTSAASYGAVIMDLAGAWIGPSSMAMTTAVTPFIAWLNATGIEAQVAAVEGMSAAAAYEAAFLATVPPPEIAANRALLMALIATNFFGINTPAIMATEALYMEMWAQDAAAMYAYAAQAASITGALTPFVTPPQTTLPGASAAQAAATASLGGSSTAQGVQSVLSQVMSAIPTTLQGLGSPLAQSSSGLSGILDGSTSSIPGLSGGSLLQNYAVLPGWFGMEVGTNAIGQLFNPIGSMLSGGVGSAAAGEAAAGTAADLGASAAADLGAGAAAADMGAGVAAADMGAMAGSVGALSAPATWGYAVAGLPSMLGSVSLVAPPTGAGVGAGLGFPFIFPPGVAATGRGAAATPVKDGEAAKYLPRMVVLDKPKAVAPEPKSALPPVQIPVPAGLPSNGDTPPGYQMVISYVPIEKTHT